MRHLFWPTLWAMSLLWVASSFVSDSLPLALPSEVVGVRQSAIVPADCGPAPRYAFDKATLDQWYSYGDCSGDYGPVDGAL